MIPISSLPISSCFRYLHDRATNPQSFLPFLLLFPLLLFSSRSFPVIQFLEICSVALFVAHLFGSRVPPGDVHVVARVVFERTIRCQA